MPGIGSCQNGVAKTLETPPPLPLQPFSEVHFPVESTCNSVPPTAVTPGSEAGYSRPFDLPWLHSRMPLSPEDAANVIPSARPCSTMSDISESKPSSSVSQTPQLELNTETLFCATTVL